MKRLAGFAYEWGPLVFVAAAGATIVLLKMGA